MLKYSSRLSVITGMKGGYVPTIKAKLIKTIVRISHSKLKDTEILDVSKARAEFESLSFFFKPIASYKKQKETPNGVPAEWITVAESLLEHVVLFLHGGSYNAGSIRTHRALAANTAWAINARTLLIDYRLAPDHPYPASLQDASAAYQWLLSEGYLPKNIVLAGDSSGGGLALGLAMRLRDQARPLPGALLCYSPWTDLALTGESYISNAKSDVLVAVGELRQSALLYMGAADLRTPYASPLYGNPRGLPPVMIQVGSDEVLLSDSVRWAESARAAGVDVNLEVWEGMQHEWQFAARMMPEGRQALEHVKEYFDQLFATQAG
jgi:monoterpene epsilon-lactone hydrolase